MSNCDIDEFGNKRWWNSGELHRLDGPAYIDGHWTYWFVNGVELPTEIIDRWMKEQKVTYPFDEPTQMLFLMKFG